MLLQMRMPQIDYTVLQLFHPGKELLLPMEVWRVPYLLIGSNVGLRVGSFEP
jgi:hypothetical protein